MKHSMLPFNDPSAVNTSVYLSTSVTTGTLFDPFAEIIIHCPDAPFAGRGSEGSYETIT